MSLLTKQRSIKGIFGKRYRELRLDGNHSPANCTCVSTPTCLCKISRKHSSPWTRAKSTDDRQTVSFGQKGTPSIHSQGRECSTPQSPSLSKPLGSECVRLISRLMLPWLASSSDELPIRSPSQNAQSINMIIANHDPLFVQEGKLQSQGRDYSSCSTKLDYSSCSTNIR